MKKFVIILVVCFITAIFAGSCNEKVCPAYSKAESSQTEING